MAKKKTIKLATTHVHAFHDVEPAVITSILTAWQDRSITPLGLAARPEREFSDALLSLTLRAGGENGFNANRSHYRRILEEMTTSPTQMSVREAQAIWLAETRPQKFSELSSPRAPDKGELKEPLSVDEVERRFTETMEDFTLSAFHGFDTQVILAALMSVLVGTQETLRIWFEVVPHESLPNIFPYLRRPADAGEEAGVMALIQAQLATPTLSIKSPYRAGAIAYALLAELAAAWCEENRIYATSTHRIICMLAGRPDLWAQVLCESSFSLNREERFYEALALATPAQLATLAARAKDAGGVTDCKRAMKRLLDVHNAELVLPMLSLYDDKKLGKLAETWLIGEGANAIHGLAELAETRTKRGKRCIDFLRRYRDLGHGQLIQEVTAPMDDKVQKVIQEHVLEHYSAQKETLDVSERPEWLTELMGEAQLAKKALPKFLVVETLPPLQTRTKELLSAQGVEWFLRALKASSLHEPHPSIPHFQQWLEPLSMSNFVEALVQSWVRDGAHASYTWVLEALGHTGNLYTPLMVEKLIIQWKREKASTRRRLEDLALSTLETLYRREQLATALAVIVRQNVSSHYARSTEANTARRERRERLEAFTELPWKHVKDLGVPRLGFNERGERDFDYGTRRFRLRLGEGFVPEFVDEQGKVSRELPRVRKSDDAEKAELAREGFRRDKSLLEDTLKELNERMKYYGNGKKHEWSIEAWERIFLRHPVTKNFARMLLWRGLIEREGQRPERAIFRISEDFKLVDVEDEDVSLSGRGKIELVPHEGFTPAEREQWADVLADYEVIQPFQQV